MPKAHGLRFVFGAAAAAFIVSGTNASAQQPYGPNDAPNLYKFSYGWAKLPDRRKWGAVVSVDTLGPPQFVFQRRRRSSSVEDGCVSSRNA